jgi:hypothetical protein
MKKIYSKVLPDAARIMSKILIKLKVLINFYLKYFKILILFNNINI